MTKTWQELRDAEDPEELQQHWRPKTQKELEDHKKAQGFLQSKKNPNVWAKDIEEVLP